MVNKLLSLALFLGLHNFANAKTLIISDIDDTIKLTNVTSNFTYMAWNALGKKNEFHGMSKFYNLLSEDDYTEINYVTNLTVKRQRLLKIFGSGHDRFLKKMKFPMRDNLFLAPTKESTGNCKKMDSHKYVTLRKIISIQPYGTNIVLIGDNTEYDPCFYHQIAGVEFIGQYNFFQYIRLITDHKLLDQQKGFVTPVEIALDLYKNNLIDKSIPKKTALHFVNGKLDRSKVPGRSARRFPRYADCKAVDLALYESSIHSEEGEYKEALEKTYELIKKHCKKD